MCGTRKGRGTSAPGGCPAASGCSGGVGDDKCTLLRGVRIWDEAVKARGVSHSKVLWCGIRFPLVRGLSLDQETGGGVDGRAGRGGAGLSAPVRVPTNRRTRKALSGGDG
ncbi:hypothetical protein Kisp01_70570 [Kineosporia sp. NBRC 101677]|nr:hypothetical protein Kisp01_70570 [Kineosporia sp. NBRC 101677]